MVDGSRAALLLDLCILAPLSPDADRLNEDPPFAVTLFACYHQLQSRQIRRVLLYRTEVHVETYFILGNWTQQGMAEIKSSPERIDDARRALERAGGAWLGWYLLMGRFDFAVILQVPDIAVVSQFLLAIGALGNARTETLRALTEVEFRDFVAKLA